MLLNSLFSNRLVLKWLKSNDMICPFYLLHSQDVHPFAFFKGYGDVARRNTGRPCSSQQWRQIKPQQKKLTGTRWAPISYKWGYNYHKKGYNSSYPFIRPFIEVITPFITDTGPPCGRRKKGFKSWLETTEQWSKPRDMNHVKPC